MPPKFFKYKYGKLPLPVFFPDATRAVLRSLDTTDIENTKTQGILVNTFHLWQGLEKTILKKFGGVREFMDYEGAAISDSGGFQVMSVIKSGQIKGRITDQGAIFYPSKNKKLILTPEKSVEFQMKLNTDMVVVLDDFTDPKVNYKEAKISVERTIDWAKRSKSEFEKICKKRKLNKNCPYILGVVQGGKYQDLREYCTRELVKIGFDGLGYGGWPLNEKGDFDYESAKTIAENSPQNYFLYGLGVGKPQDVVGLCKLGFNIFDCVLPSRDARHGRLYVYNAESINKIDVNKPNFYKFANPKRVAALSDNSKVSTACDCLLCTRYSMAYLAHLFKIRDFTAGRLATIHNLRFYSILMERLRSTIDKV
ncbi:MAG TPA: tRNA guanosine(34) transglycosylase Tgt [Patescibacteria group bacterium]|nr:tRNA guanosine(34) transglycosylase Tgt [Patescibacteria group bacterium]